MEQFNFSQYLEIIPIILCAFLIVLLLLIKKKNKHLAQQLIKTTFSLQVTKKKLTALQEKPLKTKEFQDSLEVAELTTKFQKPRLDAQNYDTGSATPGKYSEVQALSEKGMSVEEIASVLTISTHEAHQLVNLSKLAQGNIGDIVTDLHLRK